MSTLKKISLLIVLLALVAGGIYGWRAFATPSAPVSSLPVTKVQEREIEEVVRATGEVAPAVVTEIRSENSGQIAKINVRPGNAVKKGDILLELDSSELESTINESTIQIETTKLQLEKSARDHERWKKLYAEKIAPEKEFQDALTEFALAQNNLRLQEARLETLRRRLAKTIITAPLDGVILEVNVEEGMVIVGANGASAGTILMKAADLRNLLIKTNINEVDVAKLTVGMKLGVTFESVSKAKGEGLLDFISPAASGREKEKDIRVFPLIVSITTHDERIRPGISADMAFPVDKQKGLSVDVVAVFREKEQDFVFVREDGKFKKRNVQVGISDSRHVIVTEGLKDGEEVALERPPDMSALVKKPGK